MILVLTGAGAGYWIYSFVQDIARGSINCLPSDFPRYPGSTYVDENYGLNDIYPGVTCHMVIASDDPSETVTAFYATKLNTGPWEVTLTGNAPGAITFQRANNSSFGTVQVAGGNPRTEITIDTFTSTCLPIGFPHYSGAKFGGQSFDPAGDATGKRCHIVFLSNDSTAAVMSFYKSKLDAGNWQVTASADGRIDWALLDGWTLRHGRRVVARGTVTTALADERTEIKIDST